MFITFFIVLSICYLTFFYYNERSECESERQILIASIEQLIKISQRKELKKGLIISSSKTSAGCFKI